MPDMGSRSTSTLKRAMMRYMPYMITCLEFDAFITSYLDGTLPGAQRRRFQLHIRTCRACRDYLEAYRRTIALGKAVFSNGYETVPDTVPGDLVEAVLAARYEGTDGE